MTMKVRLYFCFYALLIAFASLFSGCSADDSTPSEVADEIRVNAEVWHLVSGTRVNFIDGGTLSSGSFVAAVNESGETDVYISPTTVNWVTDHWEFSDGKHYWPATGSFDFFAYMPVTIPSYITDMSGVASQVTYAASAMQFKCASLPMTDTGQASLQEFVCALTPEQSKSNAGADGVTMTFKRPFARINLMLSPDQPDIIINSIKFKSLKTGGSCSFNGTSSTWSNFTPDNTSDFVVSLNNENYTASANLGSYLMVPQGFSGNIEVKATWIDWGELFEHTVTASVPTTWVAGYSYTYTFTITETDLKVDISKFTEQW